MASRVGITIRLTLALIIVNNLPQRISKEVQICKKMGIMFTVGSVGKHLVYQSICRPSVGRLSVITSTDVCFDRYGFSLVITEEQSQCVVTKRRNDLQPPKTTYNHLQAPRKIQQPSTTTSKTSTTIHKQSDTILNKP